MTNQILITDTYTGNTTITTPDDALEAVRPWYPEAPAEVENVLNLFDVEVHGGDTNGFDAARYLGLKVEPYEADAA